MAFKTTDERRAMAPGALDPEHERPLPAGPHNAFELLIPLIAHKVQFLGIALGTAAVAIVLSYVLPNRYTSTARFLPPQQAQSSLGSMIGQQLGQLGLGAVSGLAGKDLGLKNPGDLYVGILKSRSVFDAVIEKYNLKKYYRESKLGDARRDLGKDVQFEIGKDGIIVVTVENKDAKFAADLANGFVDQLYDVNKRLAISEASQRRLFYEQQLQEEKTALADAELKMKKVQETTGLIQISGQSEAIIRSVGALEARIASKEVELQRMKVFATDENPDMVLGQQELAGLRLQLAKLERSGKLGNGNISIPTGKIPEAGLEYLQRYRDLKYHESLFEVLAKQYEAARIDEGKNAPIIQVIDRAIEPDRRSGPVHSLFVLFGLLAGLLVACGYFWGREALRHFREDMLVSDKLGLLKSAWVRSSR